jgi:hypothetical protein
MHTKICTEKPLEMSRLIRYPACIACLILICCFTKSLTAVAAEKNFSPSISFTEIFKTIKPSSYISKYDEWNLSAAGISIKVFNYAIKGYELLLQKHLLNNTEIISIVDFTKPSTQQRLFILNLATGKILFNTLVAHGRNTGLQYAKVFSNKFSSFESSLGFYVTQNTYNGNNGYSLKLKGCEKGFNDKALERNIVLHGAAYVSNEFIQQNGFLGRSYGCPAVPLEISNEIINTIKDGACLFIYFPTKKYLKQSVFINH